jgi:hypothetical protein
VKINGVEKAECTKLLGLVDEVVVVKGVNFDPAPGCVMVGVSHKSS